MAEEERRPQGGGGGREWVLLYYKYAPVPDVPALVRLYESSCLSLGLLGSVRIASDGVNVTVGGTLPSLEKHVAAIKSHGLFEGTDFKLAPCDGPAGENIARECGFTSLSIRVVKLFGGIQRYLEQFPGGGFFNDHRVSVGSQDQTVIGSCLECGTSFDDYSSRCRCTHCRMLVLVCSSCQGKSAVYVCESCQKHCKERDPSLLISDDELHSELTSDLLESVEQLELRPAIPSVHATNFLEFPVGNGDGTRKKLRILCLHGFRQNASGFKGRTASLAKKLKNIAELIFVDAPHDLPFIYQPRSSEPNCSSSDPSAAETCSTQQPPPPCQNCKKKFAWLVSPVSSYLECSDWKVANQPFDPLQYQQQTSGFQESYAFLKKVFSQMGPFDGILGFSQGAAMAALACDQQWRLGFVPDFKFAVLCSGFSLLSRERNHKPIKCPSLHIYGSSEGTDRQIACQASIELANKFDKGCSVVIEHEMGHIIPTRAPYIDQMRAFLRRFLTV